MVLKTSSPDNDRAAETKLLLDVAKGDKGAMKKLYELVAPGLTYFLKSRMRNAGEAADVVQEVFLEVWRNAYRFEGRSSAKTWIYAIARFRMIDHLRKRGRELPLEDDYDAPDLTPNAEAVFEAAGDSHQIRMCLEKLPEVQARAVKLAFYEELDYAEISSLEGVPAGTIKSRIFHAKKMLKRCLTRLNR